MLDGTYAIEVETPFGRKAGKVSLVTRGTALDISLDAPLVGKVKTTGTASGESFSASGEAKVTLLGKLKYELEGTVAGDEVHARVRTSKGDLSITGVRVSR